MWPVILALFVATQTVASVPGRSALSPEQEREARQIEALVIAPCCWSQQVSVHNSPAATQMREDIRQRLASGQTRAQILEAYTAEYGDRILAEPPARGFTRLLYVLPPVLGLAGIGLLVVVVRRFTSRSQVAAQTPSPAQDAGPRGTSSKADDEERLDEELRNLD
jgi:cytochrome c-type biogenesis protein CcmH